MGLQSGDRTFFVLTWVLASARTFPWSKPDVRWPMTGLLPDATVFVVSAPRSGLWVVAVIGFSDQTGACIVWYHSELLGIIVSRGTR